MDRSLRTLTRIFIVVLILAAAFISFFAYVQGSYDQTLSSTYTYEISISIDAPLHNVTLFVPLPEETGRTSPIAISAGAGEIYGIPEGWEVAFFGTEKASMMRITADEILPQYRLPPRPANDTEVAAAAETMPVAVPIRLLIEGTSDCLIDTRHPVGNSSVLLPKNNLTQVACEFPGGGELSPICYTYEGALYAGYDTSPGAEVSISVSLTGTNDWFVFGWSFNEFRDGMSVTLSGSGAGWQKTAGTLITGVGRYRVL
jgi:hypothetical protein